MEAIESSNCSLKLPHFFLIFAFIYGFGHKVFQNWGPKHKYEACSCFLSLFHGAPSVVLALLGIFIAENPENPSMGFGSKNTPFQNMVLEFSTAYFIMDILHYFVFKPNDVIFIAHHLATLFVLLTCRFLATHGAFPILVILVLAEITSPVQNLWSLAKLRRKDVVLASKLYDLLSPGFYAFYTVARGVVAPVFVAKLGLVYASGAVDGVIPKWVWGSWMLLVISGILASLLWILNHWIVFFKEEMVKKHKLK